MSAQESNLLLESQRHRRACSPLRVPVAVSPTHVHLTAATIEELFGDHYRLHEHSRLGQPALYEACEDVTLIGPLNHLDHVPVIGPPRADNQVEISSSDARLLGIAVPLRRSGDLVGTPSVVIRGPRTSVRLDCGVIRTLRHVHLRPGDAAYAGVREGDRVEVVIRAHRPTIRFRGVLIRVSPEFMPEFHLDSDEAKALGLQSDDHVELHPRRRRGRRRWLGPGSH